MSTSIPDFWKLVIESHLLSAQQCQQLGTGFGNVRGAAHQATPRTLAEWLVAEGALSRFQANVILSGRAGPFYYGEYRVFDHLESGRFQGYFRAQHVPTNHPVLLQFLSGPSALDAQTWAGLAAIVQHRFLNPNPYLQRYFDLVDTGSYRLLVTEDLAGQTLSDRLAAHGRMAPVDGCGVIRETALGLAWLHQLGSVHGDLRPRDVWLSNSGLVKLLHDPTIPCRTLAQHAAELPDDFLPRCDYAAPELAQPQRNPDAQADIYALGCTFYECLTGQPPFAGGTAQDKLARHASAPIQPLEAWGVPQAAGQIVAYLMAKNANLRYPQAQIVADQLAPFCDPARLHSRRPSDPPTLGAFEAHLRQRWAAGLPLSGPAESPSPKALPTGVAIGRGSAPVTPAAVGTSTATGAPSPILADRPRPASAADKLRQGRKPRQKQWVILGGSLGAAALVVIIVMLIVANSGNDDNRQTSLTPTSNVTGSSPETTGSDTSAEKPSGGKKPDKGAIQVSPKVDPAPEVVPAEIVVPDDGTLLWASPTSGEPVDLSFVPLDAQLLVHLRAASLLASDEGPRFIQGCGPAMQNLIANWEQAAGVKLADVDELIFTLHDNGDDWPRPAVLIRLRQPAVKDELLEKWGSPKPVAVKDETIYQGAAWSYYLPAKDENAFLMGSADDVQQVAEQHGAPPPLRRELGILRRMSDADRQVTILATPNFITANLLRDGRAYYFGDGKRLRTPVDWFLKDELQAVLLSLHFADDTYLEMRMIGTQGKDRFTLAKEVRDRLSQVPDLLFEYIATLGSNPYWERVRLRYPGMINFMHAKSRIGADAESAMINCRLPRHAAHNLIFGSEMVLVSTPNAAAVASANTAGPSSKPSPATMKIEDVVFKHVTSMSFEAQSLEFALQDVAKDVNDSLKGLPFEFKIKLMGKDLELDGVTRNQTIRDFMHKDKTVGEILTAMVMKANAPAVPDPSKPEQKVLWVIDKDPDNPSQPAILITTRQMAEKKNYTLSPPFRPK